MSNRLAEIEKTLTAVRERKQEPSSGPPPLTRSQALANRRRRKSRSRRRAVSFGAVSYKVPGLVPVLAQPTGMSCWATVFTMLYSWKKDQSLEIEDALAEVGDHWAKLYKADSGLSSSDKVDFVAQAGLVAEPPMSHSVEGWERMLRDYGPIWVTTDEAPGKPWAIHARIIIAIHGDGAAAGTKLTIIDPARGRKYRESFKVFIPKYEEEVAKTGHTRIQVLHWPKDAKTATAKGFGGQVVMAHSGERDDKDWYGPEDDGATSQAASWVFQSAAAKDASWASDADSPDYRHLAEAGFSQEFGLTADILKRLVEANRFSLDGGQDEVLFGLRGCRLVDPSNNAFAATVKISEDMPDHDDFHCVLGVWKRRTGEIAVFPGSTVPNWYHMNLQKSKGGQRANMLLTGRYLYTVGKHRKVQGAFIQQPQVLVVRSNDDLSYERADDFERHSPADNIHPGFSPSYGAKFSSAGCQTVPGGYKAAAKTHTGAWAQFRRAAGLAASADSKLGDKFVYLMFTGREARMVVAGSSVPRLRFGSKGADVEALQTGLQREKLYGGAVDGDMGMNTVWSWIRYQQKNGGGEADGIVTPDDGLKLGFDMLTGQSVPVPAAQSYYPAAFSESFDVRYEVQLVRQMTEVSCWAAGAAMLVGWRDRISIDPSEIARASGPWQQYKQGLQANDTSMFKAWGLTPVTPQTYTVEGFRQLLETYGPLWVASAEPGPHIRVVTGMAGDGTADGTNVYINDPWDKGMSSFHPSNKGSQYTETYRQFVKKQSELAYKEMHISGALYVAHLGEAGRQRVLAGGMLAGALRPAAAMAGDGGTAVAVASLGYTVIKDIVNNTSDPTWSLQAMDGFYHPRVTLWSEEDKKKYGLKPYQTASFEVEAGLNTLAGGRNFAKFRVEYDFNDHFVANIQLKAIGHDDGNALNYWDLHVTQTIRRISQDFSIRNDTYVAAVKLDFTYRFSPAYLRDDKVFICEHTIYGNGEVGSKRYWSQY